MGKKIFILILLSLVFIVATFFVMKGRAAQEQDVAKHQEQSPIVTEYTKTLPVEEGTTYGFLMQQAKVPTSTRAEIFEASLKIYDLSNIRLGRMIDLIYDKDTDDLKRLVYRIDSEEELIVSRSVATTTKNIIWQASRMPIEYEIRINTAEGTIESSMYQSAMKQNIDERAIIAYADVMQWSVDFAWEAQKGDTYKFVYEQRYRDGKYIMPGRILAAKYVNKGKELYAFYYEHAENKQGYFDQDGQSVEKMFLKAPVAFKYISSGFTTGSRYISAFNISTGHRAIDYAAASGTPIRSVGDGTVIYAGWKNGYGNTVSVRHSSVYQTNYAHMSGFAVRYGQKVSQGQTVGYVGSTGLSTGPHLHYEMVKNGTKINPLLEVLPPTESIAEENLPEYLLAIEDFKKQLDD